MKGSNLAMRNLAPAAGQRAPPTGTLGYGGAVDGLDLLVLGAGTVVALIVGAMVLGRFALHVVSVHGDSMTPTFRHGDQLLVLRRWFRRRLRVGDVVVCLPPPGVSITDAATQFMVKRVAAMPDGRFHVLGDAPRHSMDSRSFGPLTPDLVRGRVLRRLRSSTPDGERVGPTG